MPCVRPLTLAVAWNGGETRRNRKQALIGIGSRQERAWKEKGGSSPPGIAKLARNATIRHEANRRRQRNPAAWSLQMSGELAELRSETFSRLVAPPRSSLRLPLLLGKHNQTRDGPQATTRPTDTQPALSCPQNCARTCTASGETMSPRWPRGNIRALPWVGHDRHPLDPIGRQVPGGNECSSPRKLPFLFVEPVASRQQLGDYPSIGKPRLRQPASNEWTQARWFGGPGSIW